MTINLKVLDLSHHNAGPTNGPIDFAAIAAFGIKGIIHKASQGIANVDAQYSVRRAAAISAGLLWGGYHFADGSETIEQVKHFLAIARPDADTLMALDFEPNSNNTMSLNGVRSFLHAIEDALGRKAVLYSGSLIKDTLGDKDDDYLSEHRLWLAHYNDNPRWPKAWGQPWLHQFSGDGVNSHHIKIPGVSQEQAGLLDMNSYSQSDENLAMEWAS